MTQKTALAVLAGLLALVPVGVRAQESLGAPRDWQMNLQSAGSVVMQHIESFHEMLLYIITGITLFVLVLLIICLVKYNSKSNPNPSKTSHNTVLEVLWTVIPVIILVTIAIPSFKLLFYEGRVPPDADMTLKVTGHQWLWEYAYPEQGEFSFYSTVACRTDAECKENPRPDGSVPLRLLDTDNRVVVPVNTKIRVQITSGDVIHSWAVPSLGVKTDAVPGRLQETWMEIEKEGVYYGQCSELCGIDHGFMPIAVEAVSKQAFDEWIDKAKTEFGAATQPGESQVAQAQSR